MTHYDWLAGRERLSSRTAPCLRNLNNHFYKHLCCLVSVAHAVMDESEVEKPREALLAAERRAETKNQHADTAEQPTKGTSFLHFI